MTAVISAASSARIKPSLSVLQAFPSSLKKDAPADSSPPKPTEPSMSPGTNHLKPTGTSINLRPSFSTTLLMMLEETIVLPTAALSLHSGRLR